MRWPVSDRQGRVVVAVAAAHVEEGGALAGLVAEGEVGALELRPGATAPGRGRSGSRGRPCAGRRPRTTRHAAHAPEGCEREEEERTRGRMPAEGITRACARTGRQTMPTRVRSPLQHDDPAARAARADRARSRAPLRLRADHVRPRARGPRADVRRVRRARAASCAPAGYRVTFVRNVTDVDDKILKRALERGEPPLELSRRMSLRQRRGAPRLRLRRSGLRSRA